MIAPHARRHPRTSPSHHGLTLVPTPARTPSTPLAPIPHTPLALWHLFSLDAPTVAALWLYFAARCTGVALPWTSVAAMFVAVWMLYVADRLLDARLLDARGADTRTVDARSFDTAPIDARHLAALAPIPAPDLTLDLEARHRFHHQHRRAFLSAFLCAALTLAVLLPHLSTASLNLYAVLAALLLAYFFLIHVSAQSRPTPRLPKELAVGLFFPAAIFIPTVARLPQLRPALLPDALLLAAVCTLNCLYLYAWEHPGDRRPDAHWTTRFATKHLHKFTILCSTTAVILTTISLHKSPAPLQPQSLGLFSAAVALSAVLLFSLDLLRDRIAPVHLRAGADLALLTPALLLPFLALTHA